MQAWGDRNTAIDFGIKGVWNYNGAWIQLSRRDSHMMDHLFPEPIRKLPEADIPLEGIRAYLSQSKNHQLIFMQFEKDVVLPEHAHATQVGFVLSGRIDLTIGGQEHRYSKGDIYTIPAGVPHSGRIHAGYADITFFDESDRYQAKIG